MTEFLNYERYLTYGEDVDSCISDWLAAKYPSAVAGIVASHASSPPGSAMASSRATRAETLTPVTLCWFTRSIGTSFRAYAEPGSSDPHPVTNVPTSWIIQKREAGYPHTLGEESYRDIRSFEVLESGVQFPAWKAPEDIARAVLTLEQEVSK